MRSLALAAVLVLAAAASARADGFYFTESLGGLHVGDELGQHMPTTDMTLGATLGFRAGNVSYEVYGGGTLPGIGEGPPPATLSFAGIDVKLTEPVANHVELYVKGSASYAFLTDGDVDGYAGRGLGAAAGVVVKMRGSVLGLLCLPLFFSGVGPKITGALYFEDGYDFYRFHRDADRDPAVESPATAGRATPPQASAIDAQLEHWTFGFALGSDF
jgi:hypothetical protein|nr:hypothetical protein [Kofleriaceae bacterium]